MTLMPVTRTSAVPACSAKVGASRWIGDMKVSAMGPASSIGSPITFMMRPSVAGPTGTRIGRPVSTTSAPRTRPSVASIAMARTVFSPRCWATSNTRRTGWPVLGSILVVSSALRIAGSSPSNWTSTTAPITWVRRPLALAGAPCADMTASLVNSLERRCAGNDLDKFGRYLRLARAVHLDGEGIDQVARIARGVVHRGHLRGEESGLILQQRHQKLDADVLRQELFEDRALVRLVFVERGRVARVDGYGNELGGGRGLGDDRFEPAGKQRNDVRLAGHIEIDDAPGDGANEIEVGGLEAEFVVFHEARAVKPAQLVASLAADGNDPDVLAFRDQGRDPLARGAHDAGVEPTGEAAIRRRHDDKVALIAAIACKQQRRVCARKAGREIGDHCRHAAGIRTRALGRGLGTAQFRCRHHLQRLGDLLRGLHASDPG